MKYNITVRNLGKLLSAGILIAGCTLADHAHAGRADESLWIPQATSKCKVIYSGKDAIGKKTAEIIADNNPDSYFSTINLVEKKDRKANPESYRIHADSISRVITVTAPSAKGLMYGALSLYRKNSSFDRSDAPTLPVRVLNHWDNLDGTVERGYSGHSIWNWNDNISPEQKSLYEKYALANAMAGINGTVLNNVNASPSILDADKLGNIAEIAAILRPYGLKVYLSVNFASPMSLGGLNTADPLDPQVENWWKAKVKEIYSLIPDFGGFLVKANSEGQPGPCDFGRTHAEGANMLANALKPYNGIVMWRAFVYSPSDPDRAKQAYAEFKPLDGKFADNVIVQVKNGPVDFQPREPFSPLFGAMEHTRLMAELQITQEYLGHANHLAYLAPMWTEFFSEAPRTGLIGAAGVANVGDDPNFTGHPLAQANWYAFGRLAWNPDLDSRAIADEWASLTPWLNLDQREQSVFLDMMEESREHVVDYMMPLGLHHIFAWGHHYGPQPWCEIEGARADWLPKYYHRASPDGIGFDRTAASGSAATTQYPEEWQARLEDPAKCPEKYLLWFHHLPWDYSLKSGVTLWQALNDRYDSGVEGVADMRRKWDSISGVDTDVHSDVSSRLLTQHRDAIWWRDACLGYFGEIAGKTPTSLPLHDLKEMKKINLGIDNYTNPDPALLNSLR